jgi:hypothetical protein
MTVSIKYDVKVYHSWRQNLYAMNKVLVGLLTADGVRCRFAGLRELADRVYRDNPAALFLRVAEPEAGRQTVAAVELWDRNDTFLTPALERCDVYFKRSYAPARVAELAVHHRNKIIPFGLNYACNSPRTKARLIRRAALHMALSGLCAPRATTRWAREEYDRYKSFIRSPYADAYEKSFREPAEPLVLLQTRVWEPGGENPAHTEQINEERATMVRTLRASFGDRFVGGLAPTPQAMRYYRELITPLSTQRSHYAATIGRCLVGVYVRGVHDSIAFKLGEYLAASRCIVTEPLVNEIPDPLVEGVNVMGFTTPEECVAACQRLLDDTGLQAGMRESNYRYYMSHVEPRAHALELLRRALDHAVPRREPVMAHV